jgi:hypothetical protein
VEPHLRAQADARPCVVCTFYHSRIPPSGNGPPRDRRLVQRARVRRPRRPGGRRADRRRPPRAGRGRHRPPGGRYDPALAPGLAHGAASVHGPLLHRLDTDYGNAILCPQPPSAVRFIDLQIGRREPRGAIDADIEVDGQPPRVIATHLRLLGNERRRQMRLCATPSAPRARESRWSSWRTSTSGSPAPGPCARGSTSVAGRCGRSRRRGLPWPSTASWCNRRILWARCVRTCHRSPVWPRTTCQCAPSFRHLRVSHEVERRVLLARKRVSELRHGCSRSYASSVRQQQPQQDHDAGHPQQPCQQEPDVVLHPSSRRVRCLHSSSW